MTTAFAVVAELPPEGKLLISQQSRDELLNFLTFGLATIEQLPILGDRSQCIIQWIRACTSRSIFLVKTFVFSATIWVLLVTVTRAQAVEPQSTLEVATVRPTPRSEIGSSIWSPPGIGRFSAHCVTVPFLIHMAYGIDEDQIGGKAKWMDSEFFDVVVKPEGGIPLSREQLKPVLQALLKDRFHLIAHGESKLMKGYILVCAKNGPKLQPSNSDKPPNFRIYVGPGRLEGLNWSMPYLATMLQHPVGLPVVDQTGLTGTYDIKLYFALDVDQESSLPSLFTALHEDLGLELRPGKVSIPMLVIDHLDRIPTEN